MTVFDDTHLAYRERSKRSALENPRHDPRVVVVYGNLQAQRDGALDSGVLRFYGRTELHAAGAVRDAIFARLDEREATHVGADKGLGVLIEIERAEDVHGKPLTEGLTDTWFGGRRYGVCAAYPGRAGNAIRSRMAQEGIDCLVVIGSDLSWGLGMANIRYFSQIASRHGGICSFPSPRSGRIQERCRCDVLQHDRREAKARGPHRASRESARQRKMGRASERNLS